MEKDIEIALANMMTRQDKTAQVVTDTKDSMDKILEIISEDNKRKVAEAADVLLSKSSQEQQHKELTNLIHSLGEQINQLKEHIDKQPRATVQSRTITFFPEFHSAEHYRLLFRCIPVVLAIILCFILLTKVFNYYFVHRNI